MLTYIIINLFLKNLTAVKIFDLKNVFLEYFITILNINNIYSVLSSCWLYVQQPEYFCILMIGQIVMLIDKKTGADKLESFRWTFLVSDFIS